MPVPGPINASRSGNLRCFSHISGAFYCFRAAETGTWVGYKVAIKDRFVPCRFYFLPDFLCFTFDAWLISLVLLCSSTNSPILKSAASNSQLPLPHAEQPKNQRGNGALVTYSLLQARHRAPPCGSQAFSSAKSSRARHCILLRTQPREQL